MRTRTLLLWPVTALAVTGCMSIGGAGELGELHGDVPEYPPGGECGTRDVDGNTFEVYTFDTALLFEAGTAPTQAGKLEGACNAIFGLARDSGQSCEVNCTVPHDLICQAGIGCVPRDSDVQVEPICDDAVLIFPVNSEGDCDDVVVGEISHEATSVDDNLCSFDCGTLELYCDPVGTCTDVMPDDECAGIEAGSTVSWTGATPPVPGDECEETCEQELIADCETGASEPGTQSCDEGIWSECVATGTSCPEGTLGCPCADSAPACGTGLECGTDNRCHQPGPEPGTCSSYNNVQLDITPMPELQNEVGPGEDCSELEYYYQDGGVCYHVEVHTWCPAPNDTVLRHCYSGYWLRCPGEQYPS